MKAEKTDYTNDYQTPMPVAFHMASMIPTHAKRILEPTKGIGNLVTAVREMYSDKTIIAPIDFFLRDRNKEYDCVIMNPPFTSKSAILTNAPKDFEEKGMKFGYHMLTECMKMSDSVIALMPWFTLSDSDVRMRFLKDWGIKSLTALPRKTFEYARIQTVIIELRKNWPGETIFKTFDFNSKHTHFDKLLGQTFIPSAVNKDGDVRHTGVALYDTVWRRKGAKFETWLLNGQDSFIKFK